MLINFTAAVALFATSVLAYPADADRQTVQAWDDVLTKWGYDYEMYTATTDDQWDLTLFRILGKPGEATTTQDKPPVLLQHGNGIDATIWLEQYADLDPMPMQLVSQGYDVWMSNSRGTRYSNVNPTWTKADNPQYMHDYQTQNLAKYDFDFSEEGVSDHPAVINKILEVTAQPKVTYIGYYHGTTSMLYGLAKMEESYYSGVLNKAIFLQPCVYTTVGSFADYKEVSTSLRSHNINQMVDSNWTFDQENICDEKNADGSESLTCSFVKSLTPAAIPQPFTTKSFEHYQQVGITDRFQEYVADFASSDSPVQGELISFDSLNKVPIQFIVAKDETACTAAQAVRLHDEVPTVKSYKLIQDAEANYFLWNNSPEFVNLLVEEIELDFNVKPVDSGAAYLSVGLATVAALAALF